MRHLTFSAVLAAAVLVPALAAAQPAASASAPAASAARGPGMGPGMGPGAGRGPGARAGSDYTPGWSMMTPKEREEHRASMRNAKTADECKALMDRHHELMSARAKERGAKPLATPRRQACAGFKP